MNLGKIAVVGELLIDFISDSLVDELAQAKSFGRFFAGSPGNLVSNLRDLNIDTSILSRVGDDSFGRAYIDLLKKKSIDTSFIQIDNFNPTSFVIVSRSRANPQFIAMRGADSLIEPPEESEIERFLEGAASLHLTSWPLSRTPSRDTAMKILEVALERGIRISLDPNFREVLWERGHDGRSFMKELLRSVDITKPSDDDAFHIFGELKPREYLDAFHRAGAKNVILTLGKRGALVSDGSRIEEVSSCARRVVDTTGAGDAFWSGLYAGLIEGRDIFQAAEYGSYCAAFRIEHEGKEVILPSIEALKTIYQRGEAQCE